MRTIQLLRVTELIPFSGPPITLEQPVGLTGSALLLALRVTLLALCFAHDGPFRLLLGLCICHLTHQYFARTLLARLPHVAIATKLWHVLAIHALATVLCVATRAFPAAAPLLPWLWIAPAFLFPYHGLLIVIRVDVPLWCGTLPGPFHLCERYTGGAYTYRVVLMAVATAAAVDNLGTHDLIGPPFQEQPQITR